jgi:hypothetical protein
LSDIPNDLFTEWKKVFLHGTTGAALAEKFSQVLMRKFASSLGTLVRKFGFVGGEKLKISAFFVGGNRFSVFKD